MTKAYFGAFQSTLPREERRDCSSLARECVKISIHAPTRGATISIDIFILICIFQSTLPREERLALAGIWGLPFGISIHAPTRGATAMIGTGNQKQYISIHAPTRGATAILHKKFVYFYTIPTINI